MGKRTEQGAVVLVDDLPLESAAAWSEGTIIPMDWGNSGINADSLAFSLLYDALESEHLAQEFRKEYLFQVVAKLNRESWTITQRDIWKWFVDQVLRRYDAARRKGPSAIIV